MFGSSYLLISVNCVNQKKRVYCTQDTKADRTLPNCNCCKYYVHKKKNNFYDSLLCYYQKNIPTNKNQHKTLLGTYKMYVWLQKTYLFFHIWQRLRFAWQFKEWSVNKPSFKYCFIKFFFSASTCTLSLSFQLHYGNILIVSDELKRIDKNIMFCFFLPSPPELVNGLRSLSLVY